MKTISATEFKAKCLALLDEVKRSGETITILKRGHPVAQLIAVVEREPDRTPQESLKGTVEIVGDVVDPVLPAEAWEAERS